MTIEVARFQARTALPVAIAVLDRAGRSRAWVGGVLRTARGVPGE